jgi:tetratricopeptide (TPR) repeat protein
MRTVVSALASAASASPRDFGGSGNAGGAAAVSATVSALARSTIRIADRKGTVTMKSALGILALLVACNTALAADTPASSTRSDPMMDRYTAASERQDWKSATAAMKDALASDPRNADYHNLYAYSLRKSGSADMDLVFKHYNEALRLDPKHKGAHEYLGEAYLMVGNVAKAKEHLSALDKLCFFGCSEYSDLKRAISEHETKLAK